jgi:hypothetical protein
MSATDRILVALACLMLAVVGIAFAPHVAQAQAVPPADDNTGKIISGSVPTDGGFGLIVYGGGTYEQLVTASGCPMVRVVFWATRDGSFVVYVPGSAVAAPNAGFQAAFPGGTIPANTGLIGRCTPAPASGIEGLVTVGPLCEIYAERPGILPCPGPDQQPYQATIVFLDAQGNQAARTASGTDGRYRVVLSPGPYTVVPLTPPDGFPWPRTGSMHVTVPAGVFIVVNIEYDSGIRYLQPQ